MATSLNYTLTELAKSYFIKYDSTERTKITNSLESLKKKLNTELDSDLIKIIEFGSYKRDTILPRDFDDHSDIDLMIVFDHQEIDVKPATYRKYLMDFANKHYSSSVSYKDKPTVVLELNHIKYDLVPAYQKKNFWGDITTYIPRNDSDWMETDPNGFSAKLTEKNTNNNSIIKPIIRLMKAWNSKAGYPIESFSLEKEIVDMTFYSDTIESGFFRVIENLNTLGHTDTTKNKINALKSNAIKVKDALRADNESLAKTWLGHILPIN